MLEGLTTIDQSGKIVPGIAESWDINEDGTVYTFHLRDAKWSDGQAVTAGDFVYAWQRVIDPGNESPNAYNMEFVKNVEAVDDNTFKATLNSPCGFFLELVDNAAFMPVRSDMVNAHPDDWTQSSDTYLSDGPYMLKSWDHKSQIVIVKNKNYWNASNITGPDKIVWKLTDDADGVHTSYEANDIQYASGAGMSAGLYSSRDLMEHPSLGTYYLDFNNSKSPFDNAKVREAINLVIDRNHIVDLIGGNQPADNFVPKGFTQPDGNDFNEEATPAYSIDPSDYESNVSQAQQLLAEAGYNNDGNPFPQVEYITNDSANNDKIADYIQQALLDKLGITVNVQKMDWGSFSAARSGGNFDIARDGWMADYSDPYSLLQIFGSGNSNNSAKYDDTDYDSLLSQSNAATDMSARFQILQQAQNLLMNQDYAVCPLYYYTEQAAVKPSLRGVTNVSSGFVFFFWTTQRCTVSFYSNGGSGTQPEYTDRNATIKEPAKPERDGYKFDGWFKESNCINKWDFDSDTVESDAMLYAGWTGNPHTVTLNFNNGSSAVTETVATGDPIPKPDDPKNSGYIFKGWYTDNGTFSDKWDFDTDTMPDKDVTLYADWSDTRINVTFNPGSGASVTPKSIKVANGDVYGDLPIPVKSGCYFYGWYTGMNGNGDLIEKNDTVNLARDTTLYAKWVKSSSVALSAASLTVKVVDHKTLALTWNPVANADGYLVLQSVGNSNNFTQIADTGNLSYNDTGLTAGTKYYYEIKAYWTPYLTQVTSTSSVKYAAPAWPSITLGAASQTYNSVQLSWNSVTGASQYEVLRCDASYKGPYSHVAYTGDTAYTDTGLTAGHTYYYEIAAWDGSESSTSGYKSAKPAWPLLTLKAVSQTYESVQLNWNTAAGATQYEIKRSDTSYKGPYNHIDYTVDTTYTDTGLDAGHTYYYVIVAWDGTAASSDPSGYKSAKPVWPSITLSAASQTYNSVLLNWNSIAGATKYEIKRSDTTNKGTYNHIGYTDDTTYTDTGLITGHTYYYEIVACDGTDASSAPSVSKSAKPVWPSISPKAASQTYNSVLLNWNTVAGATQYEVKRSDTSSKGPFNHIDYTGDTTYTDTSLVSGHTYYYEIVAWDGTDASSAPSACKPVKPVWPSVTFTVASQGYDSILVDWDGVTGATGYKVLRCDTSYKGTYSEIANITDTKVTSYLDDSLTTGKTYYYKIMPYDGTESSLSVYKYAKPVPSIPGGLDVEKASANSINISWDAVEGATGYEIYRSASPNGSYTLVKAVLDPSYVNTGLTAGKTYYYKVRAYTLSGSNIYGAYSGVLGLKL